MAVNLWIFVFTISCVFSFHIPGILSHDGMCQTTEVEMDELGRRLEENIGILDIGGGENSANTSCYSLKLAHAQNSGNYLVKQREILEIMKDVDPQTYKRLSKEFENQLGYFNSFIENLKHNTNVSSSKAEAFFGIVQKFQERINTRSVHSSIKQYSGNETVDSLESRAMRMIATFIRNAEYDTALRNFITLMAGTAQDKAFGHQQLRSIIRMAYGKEEENLSKIIGFLNIQPSCDSNDVAYSALLENMQKYGHMNSPKILLALASASKCEITTGKVFKQIEPYSEAIIMSWVQQINNGNFGEVLTNYDHEECPCELWEVEAYNRFLPKIIKEVYNGSVDNFGASLKFINALPLLLSRYHGYDALFKELTKSGQAESRETLQLIYQVKVALDEASKENNNHGQASKLKCKLKKLKAQFPKTLRQIIWNRNCTIQNVLYGEYLYVENITDTGNNGDHHVFLRTGTPSQKQLVQDWQFKWRINEWKNATVFTIENVLLSTKSVFQQSRLKTRINNNYDSRRSSIWTENPNIFPFPFSREISVAWKIHPKDGKFRITKTDVNGTELHGAPLFAEDDTYNFDEKRRRVFTWMDGPSKAGDTWNISCD